MIENPDQQLSDLGSVPDDIQAIVARTLGDRPITPSLADELLEALSAGRQFELPPAPFAPAPSAPAPSAPAALPPPAIADAAAVLTSISGAPPALDSVAPPALDSVAPPPPIESEPSRPAAMPWDSLPAPPPPVAAAMPWDSQPAPEPAPEVTAQAIVAAFDDPEPEAPAHDTLESSPAPELHMEPAPSLELNARAPRRGDWSGSRRPDLDQLLDQPLDALDFERSEQTDVDSQLPHAEEAAAADSEPSAAPTTPPSSGDDFEILVDDEILEIAEDDVELVDDENS